MSRLDSFIRRLIAQRDILNAVADEVKTLDGPVLELGLGNGRTFDHLRELFPDRRVVAFDRAVNAYGPSMPEASDLVLGEIKDTLRDFIGIGASLAHADIGTGYEDKDAVTVTWLPDLMAGILGSRGLAVSGLPLDHPDLDPLPLPTSVKEGRYFIYRRR
ncbi:class I SAM-dependent methyltransferase [Rhizobium calliandrae]|uniref:Class I SAM-dependent methyltransferase n=1 Tax=Rhizobium calliandrae TaxID=1312182 RepID=A0ABT7KBL7_9HYPH|nr:class I SAM-dependent methyltransferase [Rhizobium calliandrae]MDL2406003.1 class I SAM-dependent methyltransferase [Rhizobium calliandrae]